MSAKLIRGFRAFISYHRSDSLLANRIACWIKKAGGWPIWDQQLAPGILFGEEIRELIPSSDAFLVLMTDSSVGRPWVLQETGYALAARIPIIPISTGPPPDGLIRDRQAVQVAPDGSDLEECLAGIDWVSLVERTSNTDPCAVLTTLVRSPLDRTKLLGQYARRVEQLGDHAPLRQRAGLSVFSIPTSPMRDPIWSRFDGSRPRTDQHHQFQREERRSLEAHARTAGCKLLFDHTFPMALGDDARRIRLQNLRDALVSLDQSVQAMTYHREYADHLTILGTWWLSESQQKRGSGYETTMFTWHAPTVRRFVIEFDEEFEVACQQKGVRPEQSLSFVLDEIDRAMV